MVVENPHTSPSSSRIGNNEEMISDKQCLRDLGDELFACTPSATRNIQEFGG
jgi:hypothetical protein